MNELSESVNIASDTVKKIRLQDRVLLTSIYRDHYPMVRKYIRDNSGSDADAQDIFQDAVYLLIQKCQDEDFVLTSKLSTFLFGISRHLWLKQLDRTKRKENLHEKAALETSLWESHELEEQDQQLKSVKKVRGGIEALGEPCNTILKEFYFLKSTMEEIAQKLRYSNAHHAKNQKYKCFMRLKKYLIKTPNQS